MTRAEVEGLRERRRLAVEEAERNRAVTAELRRDMIRALDDARDRRTGEARMPLEPPFGRHQRSAPAFWDASRR